MDSDLKCRITRRYTFTIHGDHAALQHFVREVLADEVSDEIHEDEGPALTGFRFYIDYGLRTGCLDLEREYILRYYRELESPGFDIEDLVLSQRVYLTGEDSEPDSHHFVKDLVNPVIHTWKVQHA